MLAIIPDPLSTAVEMHVSDRTWAAAEIQQGITLTGVIAKADSAFFLYLYDMVFN